MSLSNFYFAEFQKLYADPPAQTVFNAAVAKPLEIAKTHGEMVDVEDPVAKPEAGSPVVKWSSVDEGNAVEKFAEQFQNLFMPPALTTSNGTNSKLNVRGIGAARRPRIPSQPKSRKTKVSFGETFNRSHSSPRLSLPNTCDNSGGKETSKIQAERQQGFSTWSANFQTF